MKNSRRKYTKTGSEYQLTSLAEIQKTWQMKKNEKEWYPPVVSLGNLEERGPRVTVL